MRIAIRVAGFLWALAITPAFAVITPEQRAKVVELSTATTDAGQLYSNGKYLECANKITEIQQRLVELLDVKDPALQRLAKPVYSRLQRAHGLLELEGAELEPLPSWKELVTGDMPQDAPKSVSFSKDIAPWLIAKCGNCHINARRGQFSMATFAALLQGVRGAKVLYAGDTKGSRLIEVVEVGDMPPGNTKATPGELKILKLWIEQGAKFDGPNPNANLSTYAKRPSPSADMANAPTRSASGNETVSFAKDIAPVLLENCNGCHIAGRRASGNLRMDTFAQLMRGGSSGELIAGTNANNSLLIKKLKGQEGQRMPAGGRPPLSESTISLISTWIREGSTFDGPTPSTNIDTVVKQSWASEASHQELFASRQERSLANWAKVLPNDAPESAANEEVFVMGNVPQSRIQSTLQQIEEAVQQTKKLLRAPAKERLIRGGLTVFVLKSRYDYSEFGKMTENRELPQSWLGHWRADPLDVYAVLASNPEMEETQAAAIALQVVAGAYVGSFTEVPNWFAEGAARNLVVTSFRRSDNRIKQWQTALPAAMQKVDAARTLLEDRLDEEASGLVGMALTNFMMSKANRRRFDKLLQLLREGRSFDEAATFAFAPPDVLVKNWLGKK